MRNRMTALLLALAAVGGAAAQDRDALALRGLAATCANCHGTDGRAVEGSSVGVLAGMPRERMVEQLRAFRSGARPATIMHQLVKGYSDAQIDRLAGYFASQKRER